MPITEVTGPDGRLHHIEHPAGALPSQIIKIAQSQIGPGPSKPGAVSNLFRAGLAGASEVGYDTLQFLADETIKFRAGEEATRAKIEAQYGDGASVDERLNEIEERKRERLRKSQFVFGDTGRMSGEAFGVEEGRFSADLGRGFGQLVPLVATRGFSAVPMAFMESRRDAEQTFGLNYADMDEETQKKVDIAAGTYAMFSYGLNRVGLEAMGLNKLDDFLKGSAKIKGSVVKEIFKGGLKGGSGEFITETIEAAAMDQGFSRIYDPDREFSFSDIKDYLYEGFIGSIVGTTAGTGTSTVKALAGPPQVAVEEEGKPTEEGESLEVPRSVEVTYKQIDGKVRVVPIAVSKGQDPLTVAEEVLEGRYDKSQGLIINETFEEQPLDIGDQEAEILEEDVPVDPVPVEQAPTPIPTPTPEPSVETAPESEVDPRTGLPGFSLPQNLKKGKPGYRQTQGITFASDLERAAYSATTSTRSEPGKRKRDSYRKLLQDAGYSSTEINSMGREVRSQMRKQYKGPGSELSVALKQDAAPVAAVDELELTQEEIDIINQELDQELDPIAQAGDRLPNILDEKDITAQAFTPYRKEMMPKPEVVKAALPIFTKLKSGEKITTSESRQLASVIDRVNPVRPYKEVPLPASESDMLRGLAEDKREKINQARNLPTGTFVKLRLDIPAYRDHGVWVPTIHGATEKTKSFRGGASISHQSTSVVTNPEFGIIGYDKPAGQVVATGIASKKETKIPIATILGQYVNLTEDQAVARAEAAIKDPSFVQVGMDPKRRGYFYDRSSMQEVLSADEVIQVGPLVLAKNPVYGRTPRNEFLSREVEGAVDQDVVAKADPAQAQAKEEPLYEFVDPFNGYPQTSPMTLQEVREAMNDEDSYEKYGVILDSRNMREYRTDEQLEQLGRDVVAEAAPFTAPQKAPLSHVEQSDIIDMDALIDDIVENDIPVWFWYADQLGEGDFNLPSGGSVNLDAGPSFALQPANRAAGRVWASSKSATAINNKISQLKYTDKNGKEQTGYIFLVSGSPDTMFLFNKQAFLTFYQNAFQEKQDDGTFELRDFSDVKKEILASRPTKVVKETLNNHSTLESLMNSAASRPFIEALLAQRGKSTPLAEYLKSKGFFDIENSQLRDGFYKDNNFKLNDVLLVVKPTKAVKEKIAHKTYTTPVYGEVVGVPDKAVDAYLLMPDSVRKNKEITMDPPQAAQVVAPYGARVTTIKKIVGSQQARRAVKKLRKVIEDSPDGFTVDTAGEFATGGYIVAPDKATERVIDKNNFNEESLTQYIIDNKPHLNVEGAMLGGWYDSKKGRYVLDVVFAVDTEQDAVDIAIWGDQDAIFNLDTSTEIRTKDDNKNPTTPQGDTRTASEILSRKPTQNLGEYSSQRRRDSRGVRQAVPGQASPDVTAQAAETAAEDRGPQETFSNINQLEDFISKSFSSIADKMGINIYPNMVGQFVAQYNVTQKIIEYNPRALLNRTKAGVQAAMREEIIHAAMHNVLIQKEKKARTGRSEDALWVDFFTALGNNLTPQERAEIKAVYQSLQEGNAVAFGSEYSRAVVQKFRYGDFTEQYIAVDKGGPAFQAIVDLLRSVQAYMAKVLGPMVKADPEAAQVIVDTVELLNAIDPSIRPKSQQVVANAYNAVDKNTAEENAEGDVAPKDASQRVREERKWWDGQLRSKLSKSLTPIITKLRRINPQFALLFQRLENTIRERSLKYKKQSQPFFNKLNSLNSKDFNELKRLLFFSPTPDEANLPKNRATMQRRDALLHKHGLLNMYRLDVQPILEEIYAQYSELGMPIGYLEDYFPRVVKDLEGLIKSYGYETKRTFGNLVREENARRKEEGLPEMESSERARFFQDFLQNKSNFGPKGVRPPGNVKVREIQTIEPSRLKFYEDPSIAFGNYTTNMVSAIEAYQVLGSTNQAGNKGETGKLGELTERLFQQGLIDEQDASELKSAAELATVQAGQELVPLRELGAATYVFTLIDVGTVLIQFLDLAKVLVLRGPTATAKGVYRTLTGNRVYDIEEDFSIVKKQIMAEFDQESGTQKLLNLGLRYVVPFQKMDVFAKHATVEATLIDFLKKANAKVGSKPYRQLMTELTIRMGPDAAFKAVQGMRRNTFDKNLPEVKEAVMMELFDRQPLTYLQIPETHRRNPNSRLLYKLKTFMLLDINFNRELALNDLMGPDKTVKQRYKGLKMLVAMMAALTAIGVPKDLLLDFIRGKDTYLSDHVINNMLQVFGLSRYGIGTIFEDGPVDAIVDRFKPAAYSILDGTENDLLAWVKGDREISEFKVWKNLPVFDVWGRFTEDFQEKKRKLYREKRKEGQRPTIRR